MLQVKDLTFDYSDNILIQKVSFFISRGMVLHVKGKNGSGKTTLLKLLAGLLKPLSGEISVRGEFCYVGHQNGVNLRLTPLEHVRMDLNIRDSEQAYELLSNMALSDVRNKPCGLLSAGQKRRVGLLRLLASRANLWLLDEPLVGLDDASLRLLSGFIQAHLQHQGSVVLTSHQDLPFQLNTNQLRELVL